MWLNSSMGSEILDEIAWYYRFPDKLFLCSEAHKQMLQLRHRSPGAK
jgi:hypothetical protein